MSKQKQLLNEIYNEYCICRTSRDAEEEICFKMYLEKYANAYLKLAFKKIIESNND